jgi:hypothetical protein
LCNLHYRASPFDLNGFWRNLYYKFDLKEKLASNSMST